MVRINGENNNVKYREEPDEMLVHFKEKQRIRWWINAWGWWILCGAIVLDMMIESKVLFLIGFLIGIVLIAAGIIYSIVNRLYKCPYCGGFILRDKCLSCGKRWMVAHR